MSINDIILRKADDPLPDKNTLPRGVHVVVLNNDIVFVRKQGKYMLPLPPQEQEELRKKHIV